jgi:hypothetical protein
MRFANWKGVLLLLAGSLAAAAANDISGKWTAQTLLGPSGSEQPVPTTFTFQVEGGKLTGSVESPRGNNEILDGKVDGDSITFSVLATINNSRVKMFYDGRMTADGIDFISKFQGGDRSDHFLAKRLPD